MITMSSFTQSGLALLSNTTTTEILKLSTAERYMLAVACVADVPTRLRSLYKVRSDAGAVSAAQPMPACMQTAAS